MNVNEVIRSSFACRACGVSEDEYGEGETRQSSAQSLWNVFGAEIVNDVSRICETVVDKRHQATHAAVGLARNVVRNEDA